MRNPRLLHAAARGAVIEMRYSEGGRWHHCNFMDVGDGEAGFEQRIRPGDEHLQYGPLSTLCIEAAEDYSEFNLTLPPYIVLDLDARFQLTELNRSIYLLLVAEELADLGL